ncbi:hypothetical protein RclHR1_07450003 [Rhizophagus clarus]|uniref:Uncharacterized protein n=1 Tax=Rhizophagus clarus TaxID=94130 RepID=A0A2Z6S8T1_9GLOM|nr:hypothetical protein RclHR1_07450003 [Rhizophagus clarus]
MDDYYSSIKEKYAVPNENLVDLEDIIAGKYKNDSKFGFRIPNSTLNKDVADELKKYHGMLNKAIEDDHFSDDISIYWTQLSKIM